MIQVVEAVVMKRCVRCNQSKSLEEFHVNGRARDIARMRMAIEYLEAALSVAAKMESGGR